MSKDSRQEGYQDGVVDGLALGVIGTVTVVAVVALLFICLWRYFKTPTVNPSEAKNENKTSGTPQPLLETKQPPPETKPASNDTTLPDHGREPESKNDNAQAFPAESLPYPRKYDASPSLEFGRGDSELQRVDSVTSFVRTDSPEKKGPDGQSSPLDAKDDAASPDLEKGFDWNAKLFHTAKPGVHKRLEPLVGAGPLVGSPSAPTLRSPSGAS